MDKRYVNIIVVDDHDLLREGIKSRLSADPRFSVIAEGKNGKDAISLCQRVSADILLIDVSMPILNGLDAVRELKETGNPIQILFLSVYDDYEYVSEAMRIGADGFILKDCSKEEMFEAIDTIGRGNRYFSAKVAKTLEAAEAEQKARACAYGLSSREKQVLAKIAQGLANKQIAYDLDISVRTVESHRSAIRDKTGGGNAAALAKIAADLGL